MSSAICLNKNILEINGSIHFGNVVSECQRGLAIIETLDVIQVDLKNLSQSDSSGLALFSAWVRAAKQQNKVIQFIRMPNFMRDILRVCGLEGVLPVLWEN